MALAPGTRLGPYEILSTLGAGGMGEVYRARDTKLGREVALKVLLEAFAQDAERMARFEREAKVLASLNHPNIATIHGLEESNDLRALVMELVEGPTLAERIAKGPIPLDEALPIAKQIAEGLEYAHERGIIHRDLKPANIKITPDGAVKLLDFGLAKALDDEVAPTDASHSPTLTMAATKAGIILGTAAYMSPEQARGHAADRRADIWSFGVVSYEMLTGKPCFAGDTVSDTLAAVLRAEIPLDALPADVPPPIRKLLCRCLDRDRKRRLRDIGEARIAIEEYLANPADSSSSVLMSALAAPGPPLWRRMLPWATAGLMTLGFAFTLFALLRAPAPPAHPVTSFEIDTGELTFAGTPRGSRVAISPDGRKIAFVAIVPGSRTPQLYLRSMDDLSITSLPGTQGAAQPFFSPDSRWVGFSADEKLKKVPLTGGLPVTLCDVSGSKFGVTATWADNGSIYFIAKGKVDYVPGGGGTPEPVAGGDQDQLGYRWVASLPGSRGVLLVTRSSTKGFNIDVLSLETGKSKRLIDGGSWPRYLPTGQILYAQFSSVGGGGEGFTGGLLAVPFDLKRLALTGSQIPVMEGVLSGTGGAGFYDVAANGTLVYLPSSFLTIKTRLAWLDSKGKIEPLPAPPENYRNLSISPDGKRMALTTGTASSGDIYIYDLARGTLQRLTFGGSNDDAVFTPDGARVIYDSSRGNRLAPNLWWRRADGSGNAERLTTSKFRQVPCSISPDGKLLAYFQVSSNTTGADLYVMPLAGDRKPRVFLRTPSNEVWPMFSPDGKWIAYMSDESGRWEIFVQAFPGPGGKHQISTEGGVTPVWSRDGKELYYASTVGNHGDNLMAVDVATHPTFRAGIPRPVPGGADVIQYLHARDYDTAPGGRILVAQRPEQSQQERSQLHVILNFATEVLRRLPAAKQ